MIKVDCTSPNRSIRAFMDSFQVTGMPTLIFLTNEGHELKKLREVGFVGPGNFLKRMEATLEPIE